MLVDGTIPPAVPEATKLGRARPAVGRSDYSTDTSTHGVFEQMQWGHQPTQATGVRPGDERHSSGQQIRPAATDLGTGVCAASQLMDHYRLHGTVIAVSGPLDTQR